MSDFWFGALVVFLIFITLINFSLLGQMIKTSKETKVAVAGMISIIETFQKQGINMLAQRFNDVLAALDAAGIPTPDNVTQIDKGPKDVR